MPANFRQYAAAVERGLAPRIFADLVGKPFEDGARGPDRYDCVGLAVEIARRRGFTVPEFYSSETELHRAIARGGFLADCRLLDDALPGCVVLLRMLSPEGHSQHHLGTMISRFRMIHTTLQTRRSVIEPILGPLWENRILGFYELGAEPDRPVSTHIDIARLAPGLGAYPDPDEAAR